MMMRKTFFVFALVLALAGCGSETDAGKELETKSEYSVLQGVEFDYRQRKQEQPYVVEKNALSSGYDLIGLPNAGGEHGYVWLIANPSSDPTIKQIPSDVDFSINKNTLAAIEQAVQLAPAVQSYLAAHVEPKY